MTNRKDFERLIKERNPGADFMFVCGEYIVTRLQHKWEGWQMRQPEIDALKDEAARLREIISGRTPAAYQILELERDALKAENERLREELSDAQRNILSRTFGNNQSA